MIDSDCRFNIVFPPPRTKQISRRIFKSLYRRRSDHQHEQQTRGSRLYHIHSSTFTRAHSVNYTFHKLHFRSKNYFSVCLWRKCVAREHSRILSPRERQMLLRLQLHLGNLMCVHMTVDSAAFFSKFIHI